jgi:hypothetical protein
MKTMRVMAMLVFPDDGTAAEAAGALRKAGYGFWLDGTIELEDCSSAFAMCWRDVTTADPLDQTARRFGDEVKKLLFDPHVLLDLPQPVELNHEPKFYGDLGDFGSQPGRLH